MASISRVSLGVFGLLLLTSRGALAMETIDLQSSCCNAPGFEQAAEFESVEITSGGTTSLEDDVDETGSATLQLPQVTRLEKFSVHLPDSDEQSSTNPPPKNNKVRRALFCGPARFPRSYCNAVSCGGSYDGVVVYEGMEFHIHKGGEYTVSMNLSSPAMPVTLRMQLRVTADCEKETCCGPTTLTLRPIVIRPAVDTASGQMLPGEYQVTVHGFNPCLAECRMKGCQEIQVERFGVARFGDSAYESTGSIVP
jgi:hypothetical protein